MDCARAQELLEALVDGELDAALTQGVSAHVAACPTCSLRKDELDALASSLLLDAIEGPPPSMTDSVMDASRDSLAARSAAPAAGPPVDVRQVLATGSGEAGRRRLGPYEVLEFLASGSMGRVYKGRDRNLDRLVAIKEINPELVSSGAAVQRFVREARLAASLSHPNVCAIYYLDVSPDTGLPYLVMEYVDGTTLELHARDKAPLPLGEAVGLGRQVALALAEAHGHGIVHRDVKPANVLIDRRGVARVTDFGLARAMDAVSTLTGSSALVGTPVYMAPEVVRGAGYDHRSDQYSLGMTLFYALAGRLPYASTKLAHVLEAKMFGPVPDLAAARPDAPRALTAAVARTLAREPADRFPGYRELIAALDRALG